MRDADLALAEAALQIFGGCTGMAGHGNGCDGRWICGRGEVFWIFGVRRWIQRRWPFFREALCLTRFLEEADSAQAEAVCFGAAGDGCCRPFLVEAALVLADVRRLLLAILV